MSLATLNTKRQTYFTSLDDYKTVLLNGASTQQDIDDAFAVVVTAHNEYVAAAQAARISDPDLDWNQYFSNPTVQTMERLNMVRTSYLGLPPWVNPINGPMIFRYDTEGAGAATGNTDVLIHFKNGSNVTVDWGDGNVQSGITSNAFHSYAAAGVYDVSITGTVSGWDDGLITAVTSRQHTLIDVLQWGDQCTISDYRDMFRNMQNIQISALDAPDLSNVIRLNDMFNSCSNFNSNINHWNVGNIQYFNAMFAYCSSYNQPLNYWAPNDALSMAYMFINTTLFDQDISMWNVTGVSASNFATGSALSSAHNPFTV